MPDQFGHDGWAMESREKSYKGLAAETIATDFRELHPLWVEKHLRLLCSLRREFGNDIDKPIILAVIGQVMFQHQFRPPEVPDDQINEGGRGAEDWLTNVESISSSTGIPRETVRRKVAELIKSGYVERGRKGRLWVTCKASDDLAGSTDQVTILISEMFAEMAARLVKAGRMRIDIRPGAVAA